ncbi:hypothetical protein HDU98_011122 [Podochytrium sp. JEL0797]|nr:hypothetical protein HDU98_011122 [Podochytrium sp. JEL0797]
MLVPRLALPRMRPALGLHSRRPLHATPRSLAAPSPDSFRFNPPTPLAPNTDPATRWVYPSLGLAVFGVLGANAYWYATNTDTRVMPLEYERFNKFTLLDTIPVTHDTSLFRFRAANQHPAPEDLQKIPVEVRKKMSLQDITTNELVPSPNHIIVKDDSCQVGRNYTPIAYGRDYFDLLVKRYDGGMGVSGMIHDLKNGEGFILARGPVLSFPYKENMAETVVMIAGGTGITPMYQLIKRILRSPDEKTKITLVYGNKTEDDILLGNELHVLAQNFPERLRVNHVIQQPAPAKGDATSVYGRIHRGIIDDKVLRECGVTKPEDDPLVLVCGPDGMVKWIAGEKRSENAQGPLLGVLQRMGYTAQQVFKF